MASVKITSLNQLNQILENKINTALTVTYKEITDVLEENIEKYYGEVTPSWYSRTDKLKDSPIDLKIEKVGNVISCECGISNEYLNYQYPDKYRPGKIPNIPATGFDVISWNNETGSHGSTVYGKVHIWNDTINELGGKNGILNLFKKNIKAQGLNIK